jgi:hypothetical protein
MAYAPDHSSVLRAIMSKDAVRVAISAMFAGERLFNNMFTFATIYFLMVF